MADDDTPTAALQRWFGGFRYGFAEVAVPIAPGAVIINGREYVAPFWITLPVWDARRPEVRSWHERISGSVRRG